MLVDSVSGVDCRLLPPLVDRLAKVEPKRVFAAIPKTANIEDGFRDVTFRDYADAINRGASWLEEALGAQEERTVAYIAPSDLRYVIMSMAAMKVDSQLLLLSPRNSLEAQLSLLDALNSKTLATAETLLPGTAAILEARALKHIVLPELDVLLDGPVPAPRPFTKTFDEVRHKPMLIFHSSGSTALPKPVAWNYGCIPRYWPQLRFKSADQSRTLLQCAMDSRSLFIGFPLFHGAGLFFPLAITPYTGIHTIFPPPSIPLSAYMAKQLHRMPEVSAALWPPSILEDLAKDPEALSNLKRIKYIITGGAPLPRQVGECIQEAGPRVYNMHASTETGVFPTLDSGREDWQYMRIAPGFGVEMRPCSEDGVYETVFCRGDTIGDQYVFENFPHLREWATQDLFRRHPDPRKPDLWLSCGRYDDVIVLKNGEKFNPIAIEKQIVTHPAIRAALIYGHERTQPALLVEPDEQHLAQVGLSRQDLLEHIWPAIQEANKLAPAHGKLSRALVLITHKDRPMPRTPKKSVIRRKTYEEYEKELDALYDAESYTFGDTKSASASTKNTIVPVMTSTPTSLPMADKPISLEGNSHAMLATDAQATPMLMNGHSPTLADSKLASPVDHTLMKDIIPVSTSIGLVAVATDLRAPKLNGQPKSDGYPEQSITEGPTSNGLLTQAQANDNPDQSTVGNDTTPTTSNGHIDPPTTGHQPTPVPVNGTLKPQTISEAPKSENESGSKDTPLDISVLRRFLASLTQLDMNRLKDSDNLFTAGMDSLQVLQLVHQINHTKGKRYVEPNTVYANPTLAELSTALQSMSQPSKNRGKRLSSLFDKLTLDLPSPRHSHSRVVVLTGSSGSLGSYLLKVLSGRCSRVYCLVRGAAASRVQIRGNVTYLHCQYSDPQLGLSYDAYHELLSSMTDILHNAWHVDFNLSLDSYQDQLLGVRHLVELAARSAHDARIFFISSIGAVYNAGNGPVPEQIFDDFTVAQASGYAESKHLAERLLFQAGKLSGVHSAVCRLGQIAGPVQSQKGKWNPHEWLPSLVRSSQHLGMLPESLGAAGRIDWIPVDILARIIVELVETGSDGTNTEVFHVVNPSSTDWASLIPAVRKHLDPNVQLVPLAQWTAALEASALHADSADANPAIKLLDFFRQISTKDAPPTPLLDTQKARARSPTLASLGPVTDEWMGMWMEQWGFHRV